MAGTIFCEETKELRQFDLVIREEWDLPSLVTSNPIDNRSPVGDHIQEMQQTLTLHLQVTETPYESTVNNVYAFPVQTGEVQGNVSLLQRTRGLAAYEWLQAQRFRQTVAYDSVRHGLVESMAISNIKFDVGNSAHTVFIISLAKVRKAYSQSVLLPPERVKKPSQIPKIDEGAKDLGDDGKLSSEEDSWFVDMFQKGANDPALRGDALVNYLNF